MSNLIVILLILFMAAYSVVMGFVFLRPQSTSKATAKSGAAKSDSAMPARALTASEERAKREKAISEYVLDYSILAARDHVKGLDVEWDWFPSASVVARTLTGHVLVNSVHPYTAQILGTKVRQKVIVKSRCTSSDPLQCEIQSVETYRN